MQRRKFITLLAGAAFVCPGAAVAESSKVYRLGTLTGGAPMSASAGAGAILVEGLSRRGYKLGQNLAFEARGAMGKIGQMPQQMQELKRANIDAVVTLSYP